MDRRKSESMVKGIVLPVVVAVVTGVGASYMATQITMAVIETKVGYIENDIVSIKDILVTARENQIELARRSVWMKSVDLRLEGIEEKTKGMYSRDEALKDLRALEREVESIRKNRG